MWTTMRDALPGVSPRGPAPTRVRTQVQAWARAWVRRLSGRGRRAGRGGAALQCFDAGTLHRGRRRGVDPRRLVFAAVDLETTGLQPGVDRVCEIGVVLFRADGSVLGEYATLVDPQRRMDATAIHGIAAEQVRGAPTFAQIAPELERLLAGTVVVAHHLAFEDAFLAAEFRAAGRPAPRWPGLCTLVTARAQLDGPGFGLAALHRSLIAAPFAGAHSALGDSRATAELLAALLAQSPAPLRYRGRLPRPATPAAGASSALRVSRETDTPGVPAGRLTPVPGPHGASGASSGGSFGGSSGASPGPVDAAEAATLPRHTWRPHELAPRWGRPTR